LPLAFGVLQIGPDLHPEKMYTKMTGEPGNKIYSSSHMGRTAVICGSYMMHALRAEEIIAITEVQSEFVECFKAPNVSIASYRKLN